MDWLIFLLGAFSGGVLTYLFFLRPSDQKKAPPATAPRTDDLKEIEGIGTKVNQLLNDGGIFTFKQLAQTETAELKEILKKGGSRYRFIDPGSFQEQARLAAEGDWEGLKKFQDEI